MVDGRGEPPPRSILGDRRIAELRRVPADVRLRRRPHKSFWVEEIGTLRTCGGNPHGAGHWVL
jgi:hypothetical protein